MTELFSKSDVQRSMGEPKIYIFYPDTKEISYFGIPKTYKDKIDENRYKVIRHKNGTVTVEIKEIKKKNF